VSSLPSTNVDLFIVLGRLSESVRCAGRDIGQIFDKKRKKRQLIVKEGVPMMRSRHPSKAGDITGPQYYGK
jgi:hypothetical protein